jgi:peptidoglycan/xylan/chitin deacetylase (PgdA/CDA1 family)
VDSRAPTLVLTFDNLGEASELERGTWPETEALGRHPSVTVSLPWLLDELDRHGLRATFFVEAINCRLYPDAVGEIARRGHELGMHGWRHESWTALEPGREQELLARGREAFAGLGITPLGFRPPGGGLTAESPRLLREAGFRWCSPAGSEFGPRDGLWFVPFEWEAVDAYHLLARFGALLAPEELAARLRTRIAQPGVRTLILHPFLMLEERWRRPAAELLALLGARAAAGETWVTPGGRFVEEAGR